MVAINGGDQGFTFNGAISFEIPCETQAEVDHYWDRLTDGGREVQCGWLADRYGVSWLADARPAAPRASVSLEPGVGCGTLRAMGMLRRAFESHDLAVHTTWAAAWIGVFFLLAVAVEGDQPRLSWVLAGAVMLGLYHLLFRVGRWADRVGHSNPMARRATRFAWIFPVAFPVFLVWEAVTG